MVLQCSDQNDIEDLEVCRMLHPVYKTTGVVAGFQDINFNHGHHVVCAPQTEFRKKGGRGERTA